MRHYKREKGARGYQTAYTVDVLRDAVAAVQEGISIRQSSKRFGIPFGTLYNRIKKNHQMKPGGMTTLTDNEEKVIAEHVTVVSDWGFPLESLDLRLIVKGYLDRTGRNLPKWKNNLPGPDWVKSFLRRHSELKERTCQNISRKRGELSRSEVQKYFDNLQTTIEDVPPDNILNYDETNLSDDPGRKKCIFRRGVKYPERVLNSSKAAISIMCCGTAGGLLLPVYVVYKAEHLWTTWSSGGPKGTRYSRSKSGWFDRKNFEDWFKTIVIDKWAKRVTGSKVILGDNLSSHFSKPVLEDCAKYDITFACLPPNATHLLQPLDVSFYGPMKRAWRKILCEWKQGAGSRATSLPKDMFPALLSKLLRNLESTASVNLKSGFQACGIHPFHPETVLRKLPTESSPTTGSSVSSAVVELGMSISVSDLCEDAAVGAMPRRATKRRQRAEPVSPSSSDTEDEDFDEDEETVHTSSGSSADGEEAESETDSSTDERDLDENTSLGLPTGKEVPVIHEGSWVIVSYATKKRNVLFVGQVTSKDTVSAEITFVRKRGQYFVWPQVPDHHDVSLDDVIHVLPEPTDKRRGRILFQIPKDLEGQVA